MEAFAKSDDERDFYIDRFEGFLIYADLDKPKEELDALDQELQRNSDRYCPIPKLSFYETKKIMEGFVNEKVYDIDTKEKLLDIIQSKEARENFLEFIYDHHAEQEKWQQFYQERSRIRIIEWLRQNHFHFVFEEDLDLPRHIIEKLKQSLFDSKVGKDISNARKILVTKAKMYYSNEALNPRPKRGRPPKQAAKPEIEPQITIDIYTTVPSPVRPFLFSPEISASSSSTIFSSKFDSEEMSLSGRRAAGTDEESSLSQKLASLRALSSKWVESPSPSQKKESFLDEDEEDEEKIKPKSKPKTKSISKGAKPKAKSEKLKSSKPKTQAKKSSPSETKEKSKAKRILPRIIDQEPSKKGKKPLKKIVPRNR
jgi:hypothetical protein